MMLDKVKNYRAMGRTGFLFAVLCMLNACATNVVVEAEIPQPLIEQLPLSGRMVYSDEFKNFVYTEKDKQRSLEQIMFGEAQTNTFSIIFSRMLSLVNDDTKSVDVTISPELLDFQYSTPAENQLNVYEVFLKYRLRLSDVSGQELADWTIKGYGKLPSAGLGSASTAFAGAVNVALRDVGAQLATRFPYQSSIVALLSNKAGASATKAVSTAAPGTGADSDAGAGAKRIKEPPQSGENNE